MYLDIVSLFTNVPPTEIIHLLYGHTENNNVDGVPKQYLKELPLTSSL